MNIIFLASEATGLIKAGGLAYVARTLPLVLLQKEHDVRFFFQIIFPLAEPNPTLLRSPY
jgi:glycogen synthase